MKTKRYRKQRHNKQILLSILLSLPVLTVHIHSILACLPGFNTISFEHSSFKKINIFEMKLLQQEVCWYRYFFASLHIVAENVVRVAVSSLHTNPCII